MIEKIIRGAARRRRFVLFSSCLFFLALLVATGYSTFLQLSSDQPNISGATVGAFSLVVSGSVAFVATILPHLRRPEIKLFEEKEPRCSEHTVDDDTDSWFLRLAVANLGITPAKKCLGKLVEVWDSQERWVTKFDPLTLFWTRQDNTHKDASFLPIDIHGGGDFNYLDIAQVKAWKDKKGPILLRVVIPPPMTLEQWPDDSVSPGNEPILIAGTYYIKVGVYIEGDAHIDDVWLELICETSISPCDTEGKYPCQITIIEKPGFIR